MSASSATSPRPTRADVWYAVATGTPRTTQVSSTGGRSHFAHVATSSEMSACAPRHADV